VQTLLCHDYLPPLQAGADDVAPASQPSKTKQQGRRHSHQQQQQQQPADVTITKQLRRHSHQQQLQQQLWPDDTAKQPTQRSHQHHHQLQQQQQRAADIDELLQDSTPPPSKRSSNQQHGNRHSQPTHAAAATAAEWDMDDLDLLGADTAADLLVTKHARHAVEHKVRRSSCKAAAAAAAMNITSAAAVKAGDGLDELMDSSWLDGGSDAAAAGVEQAANMHRTEDRTWQQPQQQHANMYVFDEHDIFAHTHAREAAAAAEATAARAGAAVAADDLEGSFPVSPVEGHIGSSPDMQHWPQQCLRQHMPSNMLDEQLCTGAAAGTHAGVEYRHRSRGVAVNAAAAEQHQQQQVLPDIDISLQDMATPPAPTAAASYHHNSDGWLDDLDAGARHQQQRHQQQQLLQSLSPTPILAGSLAAVSADSPISFQGLGDTQLEQQQQWRLWQQQCEQQHQRKQQQLVGDEPLQKTVLQGCSSIMEDIDATAYGVYGEQRLQKRSWQLQQEDHQQDQLYQQQQQQHKQQQRLRHSHYYANGGDQLDLQLDDDPAFEADHQHRRSGGSSSRLAATSGVGSSSHAYAAELGVDSPAGALEEAQKEQELEALLLGFNSSSQFRQHGQQQQNVGKGAIAGEEQLGRHSLIDDLQLDAEWGLERGEQKQLHWQLPHQFAAGHQLRDETGDGYTQPGVGLAATAAAASTAGFGASTLPSVTEGRSFMNRLQQLLDSPFDGVAAAAETAAVPAAVAAESVASGLGEDHHKQQHAAARQQALQQELALLQQQQQQRHNMQQQATPADSCETVQQLDQEPEECSRHEGRTPAATAAANTAALPAAAATAAAHGSIAAESPSQQQQQVHGFIPAGTTGSAPLLLLPFNARLLRSASPQPKRRRRYATSDSLCSNRFKNAGSSNSSGVGRRLRWSGTAVADLTPPAAAACKHASATAGMQTQQGGQQQQPMPQQQKAPKMLADISNCAAPKAAGGKHSTGLRSSTVDNADDSVAGKPAANQQRQQQQQHAQQSKEKQRTQKPNASVQKRKQPPADVSLPQQKQLQQAKLPFLPVRSTKAAAQAEQHAEAAPAAVAAAATACASTRMPDSCTAIKREDATASVTIKQEETWHATPSRARLAASAAAIGAAAAEAAKLRSSLSKPRRLQQSGDGAAGEAARPRKRVRFADVPQSQDAEGLKQQQQQQQEEERAEGAQPAEQGAVAHAGAESAATAAHVAASLQAAAAAGAKAAAASTAGAAAEAADVSKADATAHTGVANEAKAAAVAAAALETAQATAAAAEAASAAAGGAASGGMFATAGPSILSVDDLVRSHSGSLVPSSVSRQQLQQAHTLDQVIEGLNLAACAAVSKIYCKASLTCVICCTVMCMWQQFHAVMPCKTKGSSSNVSAALCCIVFAICVSCNSLHSSLPTAQHCDTICCCRRWTARWWLCAVSQCCWLLTSMQQMSACNLRHCKSSWQYNCSSSENRHRRHAQTRYSSNSSSSDSNRQV
jgi:hypothetical protein